MTRSDTSITISRKTRDALVDLKIDLASDMRKVTSYNDVVTLLIAEHGSLEAVLNELIHARKIFLREFDSGHTKILPEDILEMIEELIALAEGRS
jgi:hypothetical protein